MLFPDQPENFTGPWCGSTDDWRSSISSHGYLLPRPALAGEGERSDLLDLTEFQFDRRGAAEDRHRDLHARARLVDFLDHARERRERAIGHAHILADLERYRRLRAFHAFLPLVKDPHAFGLRARTRLFFL